MLPVRPADRLDRRITFALKALSLLVLVWLILERAAHYFVHLRIAAVTAVGSLFLAYLLFPAVKMLNRRFKLWQSVAIVYSTAVIGLALLLWFIVPILINDVQNLVQTLPAINQRVSRTLSDPHTPVLSHLPPTAREYISAWPIALGTYVQSHTTAVLANLVGWLFSFVSVALLCIAIPVTSIYMITEADTIKAFLLGFFPSRMRDRARNVLEELDKVVGGFVRGQLLVASSVAVLCSILLFTLDVPYALLIAVWAGVVDVVPYLGAVAGAIPAVTLALFRHGAWSAVFVTIGFVVINQIEGNLLTPRIVSRTVGVTPLVVIFSLIICGELFGIIGLLIAVPLAGTLRVLLANLRPQPPVSTQELQPELTANPDPLPVVEQLKV